MIIYEVSNSVKKNSVDSSDYRVHDIRRLVKWRRALLRNTLDGHEMEAEFLCLYV
jgi:hypothetical protein